MQLPVYLDYAATTPVDKRVAEKMAACLMQAGDFGNPSSHTHIYGKRAKEKIENARAQVADVINADPKTIVWTSGATESINLAIKGVAHQYQSRGKHIITSQIEHSAVLDSCNQLLREGFEVTFVKCDSNGRVIVDEIVNAIRSDTILISIAHVNNETGVIQNIEAIGQLARAKGIIFHVDAAQSVGKILINVQKFPVDLLSCCAHKIYGPKGVGALYIRNKPPVRLAAQIHGGAQEQRIRAGTLPTHQIIGMGEAFQIAKEEMVQDNTRIKILSDRLLKEIQLITEVSLNGDCHERLPHILNINFHGQDAGVIINTLKEIAVSRGSACHSSALEPSYVLRAMGLTEKMAQSALRFSLGRYTTESEIEYTISSIKKVFS